jgi:hypothetical protein
MEIDRYSEFPLRLLSRAYIQRLGFTDEQIAQLSDEDMYTIANDVEQACLKSVTGEIWTFMSSAVWDILKGKTDGKAD